MILDPHYDTRENSISICWREGTRHREFSKFGVEAVTIIDRLERCPDSETSGLVLTAAINDWLAEHV